MEIQSEYRTVKTCCICYENALIEYKCLSCKEGLVCYDCMSIIKDNAETWVIEMDKEELPAVLTCPCCRSMNWNYLYRHFIYEFQEIGYYDMIQKPVFTILFTNILYQSDHRPDFSILLNNFMQTL